MPSNNNTYNNKRRDKSVQGQHATLKENFARQEKGEFAEEVLVVLKNDSFEIYSSISTMQIATRGLFKFRLRLSWTLHFP